MTTMNQLFDSTLYFGGNAPFVEELYENYLNDPTSVPAEWRDYFDRLAQMPGFVARDVAHAPVVSAFAELAKDGGFRQVAAVSGGDNKKQSAVGQLVTAYRSLGTRWADLDPLKRLARPKIDELEPSFYGFTDADLNQSFSVGSLKGLPETAKLGDILETLKQTYCGTIGVEYMYMSDYNEKGWLQARLESIRSRPSYSPDQKKRLLERLTAAETLERYLHTRYVGQKRFSLEGGESLIPMVDGVIQTAGSQGVKEIVIGMAHRGRLNVLINTLGKAPGLLFDEFEGKHAHHTDPAHTGDVKYHMGYSADVRTPGGAVHLALAFNPSHLEIVNPVVEGSVYARQTRRGENGKSEVVPVIIHGDAAVAGQGVNQEMLNFAQTRGYGTGGTIHIVVNNQIGFTTSDPRDYRSSLYCTDIFKMAEAPIFHVNGDDPEAVAFVMGLAVEYRQEFKKDVVVDIVCYRKLGHNEADEPMVTQPLMYKKIAQHPTVRQIYARQLEQEGVIKPGEAQAMYDAFIQHLESAHETSRSYKPNKVDWLEGAWAGLRASTVEYERGDTAASSDILRELGLKMTELPKALNVHPRLKRVIQQRRTAIQQGNGIDWATAEHLAFASLLTEGFPIRLSGEDVGRGTFSQRHAVIYDQLTEEKYVPLSHLRAEQGAIEVIDSILSEEGVLGFEYGYSLADPNCLTIWEAQFGDFANGAQVYYDQFISSGESKWLRLCGLVNLLPHGYEGQGPEHSSARLERFLQLYAENNIQVVCPSTPASYFHALRRQLHRQFRKPLIVMTPKSLLRHKRCVSTLEELSPGTSFHRVLWETPPGEADHAVERVVLCSGKVYYDLLQGREDRWLEGKVALLRLEQLAPFPEEVLEAELRRFSPKAKFVWCQEEPRNMGAWFFVAPRIENLMEAVGIEQRRLVYAGRKPSASPATGSHGQHEREQHQLVEDAFNL